MFRPHWFQAQNPSFVAVTWRRGSHPNFSLVKTAKDGTFSLFNDSRHLTFSETRDTTTSTMIYTRFFVVKNLITYTYAINHHSCQTNQVDVLHSAYCWLQNFANISKKQQNCIRLLWHNNSKIPFKQKKSNNKTRPPTAGVFGPNKPGGHLDWGP